MTTHQELSTAFASGVPLALDRVIERQAVEGVAEDELYAQLERLLLEVRAAGATDEAEESITNVMDRLTGWCHESNRIRPRVGEQTVHRNGATTPTAPRPTASP